LWFGKGSFLSGGWGLVMFKPVHVMWIGSVQASTFAPPGTVFFFFF